jgi:two-component system alkaline phosphatase synthesis response regulator PhoP
MDKKKRVLVVEDDNGIRLAISSILERQGYEVTNVTDGEKAMEQVDKADVVLLDIFLPKITGDEFLRRIRNKGNMVPVVLMSAAMPEAEAMECFKPFKVVDYVAKPFRTKELVEKVNKAASIADNLSVVKNTADRLKGFISRQAAL